MENPGAVYELLLGLAAQSDPVEEVLIGPIWTLCRAGREIGLAMSPQMPTRTLPWPGTLCGRPLGELARWVLDWEPYAATVGMAALNAALAHVDPPPSVAVAPPKILPANLAVFEHFLPHIADRKVIVVGRYPGLERLRDHCQLTVLERNPSDADLPDPACEFEIPQADWVFLTASSLINKTFPRLAALAAEARLVLVGPTTPWIAGLARFGVDYLAGTEVIDPVGLRQTVAEGGGVRIFERSVAYRVADLTTCKAATR